MPSALLSQVVSSDVLRDARILILHMVRAGPAWHPSARLPPCLLVTPPCALSCQGRDFSFDDCGRAFTCLPVEEPSAPAEALVCNLDSLLETMTHRVCVPWAPWQQGGWLQLPLSPSGCLPPAPSGLGEVLGAL